MMVPVFIFLKSLDFGLPVFPHLLQELDLVWIMIKPQFIAQAGHKADQFSLDAVEAYIRQRLYNPHNALIFKGICKTFAMSFWYLA